MGRKVQISKAVMCVLALILMSIGSLVQGAEGKKDIILGMSTALTGPAADLGKNMKTGVLAGFDRANRKDGIHGQQLKLLSLDDGYEPVRTAPNMRRLIEKDHVLAVIGNVGTPTAIAAIPIANERQTLLFAPFSGAGVLRKSPPDRYIINYRASYAEETAAMIDALIHHGQLQLEDIAFFTQRDGYGDAGYTGGVAALLRHGLKNEHTIMHVRYERNTLAVENSLATILFAKRMPRAIIMVGAYAPCAKFIRLAQQAGLNALFLNVSFVGSTSLARDLGKITDNVIVTQVVPHPLESTIQVGREYHKDLQILDAQQVPTFGGLEGYIAARIMVKALDTISGSLSRENLVEALEGLGDFTMGLGQTLHFDEHDHQASHMIWPTILRQGKFVPFEWENISHATQRDK